MAHVVAHRARRTLAVTTVAVAVVVTMVAAAATAGAQSGEPVVEPARQLTADESPSRLYNSPAIAVDPSDPATVAVALGDNRNGRCGVRFSLDAGLSWTSFERTTPEDRPFCIQRNLGRALDVDFGSDGALYMGMSGSSTETTPAHPNGPVDAVVGRVPRPDESAEAYSIAEGTVRDDYEHRDGDTYEVIEHHKYATVAADPSDPDRVYRGWRWTVRGIDQAPVPGWGLGCPDECAPVRPRVAVSSDGGETWDEPVDVAEAAGMDDVFGTTYPELVVGDDGTAYAVVQESPDRADEGAVPRLLLFTSSDGGESWDGSVIWDGVADYRQPDVAIDRSTGDLVLAWAQRGDDEENPSTVQVMTSSDGGESWTDPIDVTDEDDERAINQYLPGVSVAPDGRIDVAWYDYRNDPFHTGGEPGEMGTTVGERFWDVYYTYSTDGGDNWAPNVRISDRLNDAEVGTTFANQDIRAPIAVASTDGAALFAWADSRAGGPGEDVEDVYFTRARFGSAEAAAAAGDGGGTSGWLWAGLGAAAGLLVAGLLVVAAVRWTRASAQPAAAE